MEQGERRGQEQGRGRDKILHADLCPICLSLLLWGFLLGMAPPAPSRALSTVSSLVNRALLVGLLIVLSSRREDHIGQE